MTVIDLKSLTLVTKIADKDIKVNTQTKLKFRKLPYAAWFMGCFAWGTAAYTLYVTIEDLLEHHPRKYAFPLS